MDMQWIDRVMDTEYATRREALKAAGSVERETLGVAIRRHGDGYRLERLGRRSECRVRFDGSMLPVKGSVEFPGEGAPDDHMVVPAACDHSAVPMTDPSGFAHLIPVIEFLDGDADGVDIRSVRLHGESDVLPENVVDAMSDMWAVLCADAPCDRPAGEAA